MGGVGTKRGTSVGTLLESELESREKQGDNAHSDLRSTMNERTRTALSKFLSYVLRHEPAAASVTLDEAGWVDVDALLRGAAAKGREFTREDLEEVVATNAKQRFAFSDDGRRIRANQGHSMDVELGYEASEPPDVLFHGTIARALASIRENGLRKMDRHHVHLSVDEPTARAVGTRRGKPVILRIDARAMRGAGHAFYRTPNGVWLTDVVPAEFIAETESDE
jgi:putative RNA 2'-phosphotransferase